jgi:hypothetical protein
MRCGQAHPPLAPRFLFELPPLTSLTARLKFPRKSGSTLLACVGSDVLVAVSSECVNASCAQECTRYSASKQERKSEIGRQLIDITAGKCVRCSGSCCAKERTCHMPIAPTSHLGAHVSP